MPWPALNLQEYAPLLRQTPLRPFPFAVAALNLNRPHPDILSIPLLPDSVSKWPKNRINVQRIRARLSRDSQFLVLRKY